MSFLGILKELVEGTDKGVASALMGVDGLAIEKYVNSSSSYDVETIGIEYGKVLSEIKNASSILSLGSVEEVVVNTLGTDIILRIVSEEYYIAFAVGHGGNVGKARYLLRRAVARTRKELLV